MSFAALFSQLLADRPDTQLQCCSLSLCFEALQACFTSSRDSFGTTYTVTYICLSQLYENLTGNGARIYTACTLWIYYFSSHQLTLKTSSQKHQRRQKLACRTANISSLCCCNTVLKALNVVTMVQKRGICGHKKKKKKNHLPLVVFSSLLFTVHVLTCYS